MNLHVEMTVQGEAGVSVGPGLGDADPRKCWCEKAFEELLPQRDA
jgi:hypothetical protein